MPAAVETMAYTNEVPWHGLGTRVAGNLTPKQMLKAAGLDWKVERMPLAIGGWDKDGKPMFHDPAFLADFAALVRDRDRKCFDVVGKQYTPTQNEEAFGIFNEAVKSQKATMETAGSLREGRMVWGLANLSSSFTLANGDKVMGYLLCIVPHQQGKSIIFKFTTVRVVCMNTLALAISEKGKAEYRRSHRSAFTDDVLDQAKLALGIAKEQMGEFEKTARQLEKLKLKREKIVEILCPIYAPNEEVKDVLLDFEDRKSVV